MSARALTHTPETASMRKPNSLLDDLPGDLDTSDEKGAQMIKGTIALCCVSVALEVVSVVLACTGRCITTRTPYAQHDNMDVGLTELNGHSTI